MRFLLSLLVLTLVVAISSAQSGDTPTNKFCSLNVLINDKCTKDNDISCRRCYFKECHKIGGPSPANPLPGDNKPFGRPFAPQDCDELNACLENADCKDE